MRVITVALFALPSLPLDDRRDLPNTAAIYVVTRRRHSILQ